MIKFGLMFFAASEDSLAGEKYRLVLESARFGDREGFSSVWVPERHFTPFGGLYPNPAVLQAALAASTASIGLRAGSVVAPLHHPLRIAEEWSVVDNLSGGRVGISLASGWNPDDFAFAPERYATRGDAVFETLDTVRRLWRGESIAVTSGTGQPAMVSVHPRPVQPELPIWITAAGNPRTFERAGASGAHLLTHILDQDEEGLAARIALYRRARAGAGFDPATGEVSLMIHTFLGDSMLATREEARRPFCEYIKSNIGLLKGLAKSRGHDVDVTSLLPADLDEFVNFLYDRFVESRGLIGTPESCIDLVERLEAIGVTELACLLDFGPPADRILDNLPHLSRLRAWAVERTRGHTVHRTGIAAAARAEPPGVVPIEPAADVLAVRQRCTTVLGPDAFVAHLAQIGIRPASGVQPVRSVWHREGEALGELHLTDGTHGDHGAAAALDMCTRVIAAALPLLGEGPARAVWSLSGARRVAMHGALAGRVWSHATIPDVPRDRSAAFRGDVRVYGEGGRLLAEVEGLQFDSLEARPAAPVIDLSAWVYERTWQAVPGVAAHSTGESRRPAGVRWAILRDRAGVGDALVDRLEARGDRSVPDAGAPDVAGIIDLRGLDIDDVEGKGAGAVLSMAAQGVITAIDGARAGTAPVWIVSRGAVAVGDGARVRVAQAPLWGLGRVVAVEQAGRLGGLIDLDPASSADTAAGHLCDLITRGVGEDMVAVRGATRLVPRLRRQASRPAAREAVAGETDGSVLITGGTGGLGLRLAAWMAARGARRLALLARNAPPADAEAAIANMTAAGASVSVHAADVADEASVRAVLDELDAAGTPVTRVFHLAGVLDDAELAGQDGERVGRVLAPKVAGAWNLHRLTDAAHVREFVLFSSVASLVPAPGQAGYAAANAFLDALAHDRRAQGLPALVVNWGPWSEAGHAATEYGRQAHGRLASLGIGALTPAQGLRVLESLLEDGATQAAAVAVDWPRLSVADPGAARMGLLAELMPAAGPARAAAGPPLIGAELQALAPDARRARLMGYLAERMIEAVKLPPDTRIDERQRLFDLGLDSILALELKDRLERDLGQPLSATVLFTHPTLDALAAHLLQGYASEPMRPADGRSSAPVALAVDPSLTEEELEALLLREIDANHGG